jgi:hypothetical protein
MAGALAACCVVTHPDAPASPGPVAAPSPRSPAAGAAGRCAGFSSTRGCPLPLPHPGARRPSWATLAPLVGCAYTAGSRRRISPLRAAGPCRGNLPRRASPGDEVQREGGRRCFCPGTAVRLRERAGGPGAEPSFEPLGGGTRVTEGCDGPPDAILGSGAGGAGAGGSRRSSLRGSSCWGAAGAGRGSSCSEARENGTRLRSNGATMMTMVAAMACRRYRKRAPMPVA